MKYLVGLVLGLFFLVPAILLAGEVDKAVYGIDNRLDVRNAHPLHAEWADSTAVLMEYKKLYGIDENKKTYSLKTGTLQEFLNLCNGERFAEQLSFGDCSSFLVGDDIMVSAGHCFQDDQCSTHVFVFGAYYKGTNKMTVRYDDVYFCQEVLAQRAERYADYAVIKLDRKVKGRSPLPVRHQGEIAEGTEVVVIGNPSGLPTKVADGAFVHVNDENEAFFSLNSDTFGGNSGSAVFNKDGVVEGILVRGEEDYIYDSAEKCKRTAFYEEHYDGVGEEATKITVVKELENILFTKIKPRPAKKGLK